jgi:hypothetical protein
MASFGNRLLLGKYSFPNVFCTPFVKEVYRFIKVWAFHAQEELNAEVNFEVMVVPHDDTVTIDIQTSCVWDCDISLGHMEALIITPDHMDLLNEHCTTILANMGHHKAQCPNAPIPPSNPS